MSTNELITKIEELKSMEELLKEAEAEVESIKDELKQVMIEENTEELEAGTHIIRYTTTLTSRFDTTAFKKEYSDLYKIFTKQTTSRRFTIN